MFTPIETPKHKKDWRGCWLSLDAPYPEGRVTAPVVRIERRLNAQDTMNAPHDVSRWGSIRIMRVTWRCPECGAHHSGYLPETFISEGKAVFMKKVTNREGENYDAV